MELRALVAIAIGEEITHSYFLHERWQPPSYRQALLLDSKYFLCSCSRCVDREIERTRGIDCKRCGGVIFLHLEEGDDGK